MKTLCILATLLVMTACTQRVQVSETSLSDLIDVWAQKTPGLSAPPHDTTILGDGTIYLDIYGLTESNLQDSLTQELAACPDAPTKITFWQSETSWSVRTVTTHAADTGQVLSLSDEQIAQKRKTNFIRTVNLTELNLEQTKD